MRAGASTDLITVAELYAKRQRQFVADVVVAFVAQLHGYDPYADMFSELLPKQQRQFTPVADSVHCEQDSLDLPQHAAYTDIHGKFLPKH